LEKNTSLLKSNVYSFSLSEKWIKMDTAQLIIEILSVGKVLTNLCTYGDSDIENDCSSVVEQNAARSGVEHHAYLIPLNSKLRFHVVSF